MHCPSKQNSWAAHLAAVEHCTCPGYLIGLPGYVGPIGNGLPGYGSLIGNGLLGYPGF